MTRASQPPPGYAYHVMRCAAERFARDVSALCASELAAARAQADKTYALESLVLASEEARGVTVAPQRVDEAVAALADRYKSPRAFASGLRANGLTESQLREALRRELWFDAVMQAVAAEGPMVTRADALRYYEAHSDRFAAPERRRARHILITVQEGIADNRRDVARNTIDALADELARDPSRFSEYACRHSECPSALDGGSLGDVVRGQLYPALEAALFSMVPGAVSDVVETELGYHLLFLSECIPARVIPFSEIEARLRHALDATQRRRRQNAFLDRLRAGGPRSGSDARDYPVADCTGAPTGSPNSSAMLSSQALTRASVWPD